MTKLRIPILMSLIFCFFTGCGWPDDLREKVEKIPKEIDSTKQIIKNIEAKFLDWTKSSDQYDKIEPYMIREKWDNYFDQANQGLESALRLYKDDLVGLQEKNDPNDTTIVKEYLLKIYALEKGAKENAKKPLERAKFILKTMQVAPQMSVEADSIARRTSSVLQSFMKYALQAEEDYAQKKPDIEKKIFSLANMDKAITNYSEVIKLELSKTLPDYAMIGDSYTEVLKIQNLFIKTNGEYRGQIAELYRHYTKILIDMKADYSIVILRTSWNENYDFPDEHPYLFKRTIDEDAYEYFESIGENVIARYSQGWGENLRIDIDEAVWNDLKIDPKENFSSDDNDSEFDVDDLNALYYHRYLITENDSNQESGWIKVTEDYFWSHNEDLGMEIVSKPYGYYENEVMTKASPPGMAYVGNEKYGEWKKDESGNSFWAFYGRWMFINHMMNMMSMSDHRYYQSSYNDWNNNYRGRKSYYGSADANGKSRQYGTSGRMSQSNPRIQKSSFARSGNIRSSGASVRGAGSKARGNGPGSRGK